MEKTEVKKVNRYTILIDELKRTSDELKAKKQEMLTAIKEAEDAYRKYKSEVYKPARVAAMAVFESSKVKNATK